MTREEFTFAIESALRQAAAGGDLRFLAHHLDAKLTQLFYPARPSKVAAVCQRCGANTFYTTIPGFMKVCIPCANSRVFDALSESVLEASDAEIIDELTEIGIDPDKEAARLKAMMLNALKGKP